jgi:hypothetical protein
MIVRIAIITKEEEGTMRKALQYSIVIIVGLIILNSVVEVYKNIDTSALARIDAEMLRGYFYISLLSFLFGILIEWKSVLNIFAGYFKVNLLIFPSIFLLIVSLLPITYTILKFGIGMSYRVIPHGIFLAPLQNSTTIIILNVLAGVLLVRSLVKS